jgi:hypothetical protein
MEKCQKRNHNIDIQRLLTLSTALSSDTTLVRKLQIPTVCSRCVSRRKTRKASISLTSSWHRPTSCSADMGCVCSDLPFPDFLHSAMLWLFGHGCVSRISSNLDMICNEYVLLPVRISIGLRNLPRTSYGKISNLIPPSTYNVIDSHCINTLQVRLPSKSSTPPSRCPTSRPQQHGSPNPPSFWKPGPTL